MFQSLIGKVRPNKDGKELDCHQNVFQSLIGKVRQ